MQQRSGLKTRAARREHWRQLIEAAESSGETIRGFCQRQGIHTSHYYYWRRRLQQDEPVVASKQSGQFVLVGAAGMGTAEAAAMELVVGSGWRLRIGAGVEERALRTVLAALAAQA
jgi:transposase-like protein